MVTTIEKTKMYSGPQPDVDALRAARNQPKTPDKGTEDAIGPAAVHVPGLDRNSGTYSRSGKPIDTTGGPPEDPNEGVIGTGVSLKLSSEDKPHVIGNGDIFKPPSQLHLISTTGGAPEDENAGIIGTNPGGEPAYKKIPGVSGRSAVDILSFSGNNARPGTVKNSKAPSFS